MPERFTTCPQSDIGEERNVGVHDKREMWSLWEYVTGEKCGSLGVRERKANAG